MVAVAASPTPGAAASSPFSVKSNEHPPYKDMIVSAIEALKDQKGSSRPAISKYIADNYSGLPATHSSLLTQHLRRLQSKGVVRKLKHSYKIADPSAFGYIDSNVGSRKRGRPLKNAHPDPALLYKASKGRGRPRKFGADPSTKRKKPLRLPNPLNPAAVDSSSIFILPQAEQLKSGFLQSLPGAVAIILPQGLLSKKAARSPVLILPNGVQSLVDASDGKKKAGRPRKDLVQQKTDALKVFRKTQPILRRRKAKVPKQVLLHNGDTNRDHVNVVLRKPGRPRKITGLVLPENLQAKVVNEDSMANTEAGPIIFENANNPSMPEVVRGKQSSPSFELKMRPVGRPRRNIIGSIPGSPPSNAKAR